MVKGQVLGATAVGAGEAIAKEDPSRHNPQAKGWLDKVRDFFGG
jgi:hypothetical protein